MNSSIQRILVPLDISEYAGAAAHRACEIARQHHAQVTGLVILDTPGISSDMAPLEVSHWETVREAVQEAKSDAKTRIEDTLRQFADICEEQHIPHSELEIEGVPSKRILEHGAYYDLVVMGLKTYFHFETRGESGHSLEHVLDRSITPVLAVSKTKGEPLKHVLIAFDGSMNSIRALKDFVALGRTDRSQEITVLTSSPDQEKGRALVHRAEVYLRSHGFDQIKTEVTDRPIVKVVDEDYIEKVDLVVAGVHAKKLLADFFVGSFTRSLINYGHTNLLLAQ